MFGLVVVRKRRFRGEKSSISFNASPVIVSLDFLIVFLLLTISTASDQPKEISVFFSTDIGDSFLSRVPP